MSYVVESASSRRARRRRKTAITLIIVIALLAGVFYYTTAYLRDPRSTATGCPTPTKTTAKASATTTKKPATTSTTAAAVAAPKPQQITVNVYNATSRSGLAASTAKLVAARGFVVGTVSNDPMAKSISGTAEIRYGENGKAAGAVVAKLVSGATPVVDTRADGSVDLVLGNGFKALAAATTATPAATSPRC